MQKTRSGLVAFACVAAALAFSPVTAAPGDLDPAFLTGVGAGITGSGYPQHFPTGAVNAVALQPGGKILVGGVRSAHNNTGELTVLKRLNSDGTLDSGFAPGTTYAQGPHIAAPGTGDAEINTILVNPDGSFYIAGVFENYGAGSVVRGLVARVNADGTLDENFVPPLITFNNGLRYVQSLALQPDGKLLIGGAFFCSGRGNIIRVDGATGALDTSFSADAVLSSAHTVDGISVLPDGRIYISGVRTGNRPMAYRLFGSGQLDASFQPAFLNDFGRVNKILALPDGRVVLGGDFGLAGGRPEGDYLACVTATGALDTPFQGNLGLGSNGWMGGVLQLTPDGRILAGGIFNSFNGAAIASLLLLEQDGTRDATFAPAPYSTDRNNYGTHIYSAAVQEDGRIVAGGWFSRVTSPDLDIRNLVRFEGSATTGPGTVKFASPLGQTALENAGSVKVRVARLPGLTGEVTVNYTTGGGTAVAGTHYTSASGTLTWAAGQGGAQEISIPILDNAAAGGNKTFGVTVSAPGGGAMLAAPSSITVTLQDDEGPPQIVVHPAGVSTNQGNSFTLNVGYASVVPATVQWQYNPGTGYQSIPGATSTALTIALSDPAAHNGAYRAVVSSVNGSAESNPATVTILTPAGSLMTGFVSTLGAGRTLLAAVPDAQQRIVALTAQNSPTFRGLQRLTATGTVDTSFTTSSFDIAPVAVHVLVNGKILVAGFFNNVTSPAVGGSAVARATLARFNDDGTLDTSFAPSLPVVSGTLYAQSIAPGAGGKYYVGFGAGGALRRYHLDGTLDTSFAAPTGLGSDLQGEVQAVRELANGQLLVAHMSGRNGVGFTYNLWRLNADGTRDTTFQTPAFNGNPIDTLDVLPDGRIIIGGRFLGITGDSIPNLRLLLLKPNGSIDRTFLSPAPNGKISRVIYRDGRILIAGEFTLLGSTALRGIARLNLDGTVDSSFVVGPGANARVNAIHYTPEGNIFAGGDFSLFNNIARNAAVMLLGTPEVGSVGFDPARFTLIEEARTLQLTLNRYGPVGTAVSVDWSVEEIAAGGANTPATAGEDFTAASGTATWAAGDGAAKTLTITLLDDSDEEPTETLRVRLSNANGLITPGANALVDLIDSDTPATFNTQPTALTQLLVGGNLNLSGQAVSPSPIAYQWYRNGVPVPGATSSALGIAGVAITDAGLYTLVATNAAGSVSSDPALVVITPLSGRVLAGQATTGRPTFTGGSPQMIVALPDGGALVGGNFSANVPNNVNQSSLIRIKPDGSTDTSFSLALNGGVVALLRQPDGKILVGGSFTTPSTRLLRLNANLTVDTTFNSNVGAGITGGTVTDVELDSTGRVYAAVSNTSASSVRRFSSEGVPDATYSVAANGGVTAIAVQADDKVLAAGAFSQIGGSAASRLARLETNGTRDAGFTGAIGGGGSYNDVLVLKDGRVFVAGANFANSASLAEMSTTGAFISNMGSGNQVYKLSQAPNGKVVVARASSGGTGTLYRIKATNPLPVPGSADGDNTFSVGTGANADVIAVTHVADGSIWVAGTFTTFDGFASGGVVKLRGDPADPAIVNPPVRLGVNGGGTARLSVGAVGTNLTFQWYKNGVALVDDVRITGSTSATLVIKNVTPADDDFYTVEVTGGTPSNMVGSEPAKLDVLGAPVVVQSPGNQTPARGATITLAADVLAATPATYVWRRDGVILSNGGRYSGAGTATLVIADGNNADNGVYTLTVTNSLGTAVTDPATISIPQVPADRDTATTALSLSTGSSNNQVRAMVALPDGRMLVAASGQLSGASSTTSSDNLIVVNSNMTVSGTAAGTFNGQVRGLYRQGDGKILVVGDFTSVGGVARPRVARLNANLSLDTTFAPTAGALSVASTVVADTEGRVYVGGAFVNYASQSGYNFLVRLLPNGSLDPSFNLQLNGSVNALARQADGKILVGGVFGQAGGVTGPGLVRLDVNGALDIGFTPGLAANAFIVALALDGQNRIYVSQSGPTINVLRLLQGGALDGGFNLGVNLNSFPASMLVQSSGKVVLAGPFNSPSGYIMRVNENGVVDTGFDVGSGFSGAVNVVAQDISGRIWAGGSFNQYKGVTANRLAVLQGDGPGLLFTSEPGDVVADVGAASVTFAASATGSNGFTFQWKKNGVPLVDGDRVSGVNTGTLTLSNILVADAGAYSVTLTNASGGLTSRSGFLTVRSIPEITLNPSSVVVDLGGGTTFQGTAVGAGSLTYQWLFNNNPLSNGVNISGATTPVLTLTDIAFANAGNYSLRVTNTLGSATTQEANLTVQRRPGALASGVGQPTFNSEVHDVLLLADGSYVVAGSFSSVTLNGVTTSRGRLVRILSNGSLDTTFPTANGTVYCLGLDDEGRLYVGGSFAQINSTNRVRVARLTSAFALDASFDTSTAGPNNTVLTLATAPGGTVFIGGQFTAIGTVSTAAVNRMAKLKTDGSLDTSFTSSAVNDVNTILRLSNGTMYVGGISNSWGATGGVARLVRLFSNGTRDVNFVSPDIFTIVNRVIMLADGSLFVSGNGFGQPYLRRQNATTGADLGLVITGHLSQAFGIAQQPDGKLLSGALGTFFRTDLTGEKDNTFGLGTGFDSSNINVIKVDTQGRIYVGGNFSTFNGASRSKFAILNGGVFESQNGLKTSQSITFNPLADRTFNPLTNSFALSATASSGLPVSYAVTSGPATMNGNTLTLTGAGSVTVTATQAGDATYAAATPVARTFQVTQGGQTISFNAPANLPAGSAPFTLNAVASSGLPVAFEIVSGPATVSGNLLTLTGTPGTVVVRATQPGNDNFTAATPVDRSFEATSAPVVQAGQTIAFTAPASVFLAEGPLTLTATATSGLTVNLTVLSGPATLAGNSLSLTGTGTVKVRATQPGNASYKAAPQVDRTITVKADPTVLTLINLNQVYTGTPRPIDTLGGSGPVTITYKVGATFVETPPTNAGTWSVRAVSGGVTKTGSLVITKAPLQVVPDNQRKFAGQPNPTLTYYYQGFLGADNAANSVSKAPTITTTAALASPGGTYPISTSGGTSANYSFVYQKGVMTVETFAGLYEAMLVDAVTQLPAGKLELTVAASSRAFTGKLTTPQETAALSLTGALNTNAGAETATGTATVKKGTNTYVVTFTLPLSGDFTASATLNNAALGAATDGKKLLVLAKGQTLAYVGAHTVILNPAVSISPGNPLPVGAGFATGVIDAKGVLRLTGKLADGTTLTASLAVDANAGYRLMVLPYTGRAQSYLGGVFTLADHPDVSGRKLLTYASNTTLVWAKAAKTTDVGYRVGFGPARTRVTLDPWLPPVAAKGATPAITLAQRLGLNATGDLEVVHSAITSATYGNLPTLVTVDGKNVVKVVEPVTTPANSTKWKVTLTPTTGLFSGNFELVDGAKKRTVNFGGALRQPPGADVDGVVGEGCFLLPSLNAAPNNEQLSGQITLQVP